MDKTLNRRRAHIQKRRVPHRPETCFSSCYFSCNSFQARLIEKNFRPASACIFFCVEVQMFQQLHVQSVPQMFKFLASSIVQVSMLSLDVMLCLLSWTHTLLKCKVGALSMLMRLSSGMPWVLHELHGF